MTNEEIRREMGMNMPLPARDRAAERFSVTTKSNTPKSPLYMIVGGVVLVQEEDGGYRHATAEEYAQIMGDVVC